MRTFARCRENDQQTTEMLTGSSPSVIPGAPSPRLCRDLPWKTWTITRCGGILSLCLMLWSCGYRLIGQGRFLPDHIETVAVRTFHNKTDRFEIEQIFTREVQRELIIRAKLNHVPAAKADAILEGTLTSFVLTPVSVNPESRATRYQVTITADVALTDSTTEKPIWKQDGFTFRDEYEIDEDIQVYFDREIQAIERIAKRFAQSVITTIMEGF